MHVAESSNPITSTKSKKAASIPNKYSKCNNPFLSDKYRQPHTTYFSLPTFLNVEKGEEGEEGEETQDFLSLRGAEHPGHTLG
jgi:hypothetical protein